MTTVGHSLIGLSFSALAMPFLDTPRAKVCLAFTCIALANLPDWPLPNWGHDAYRISHSLFMNSLILVSLAFVVSLIPLLRRAIHPWVAVFVCLAWLSHLLLDSFYRHGHGVAVF